MKSINDGNCWQGSYGKNEAAENTGPERCACAGFWNQHQSTVGKLLHGFQTLNRGLAPGERQKTGTTRGGEKGTSARERYRVT
jgi:hypothetical protein